MNTERAILKGHLADLKMKKMNLQATVSAHLRSVQNFLTGFSIRPLSETDIDSALVNLQVAADQNRELAQVLKKIKTLEAELD
ncbi:hypothetical protein LJC47_00210 [Desulfosarcina sp. OttesenSCG-928-B08]|nr:hypothetical protein [Desulfosarcina sp. OttesenSCG-928-B08]